MDLNEFVSTSLSQAEDGPQPRYCTMYTVMLLLVAHGEFSRTEYHMDRISMANLGEAVFHTSFQKLVQ